MPVSVMPDTFTSGGLLDDVDVEVTAATYEMFDYEGKAATPAPVLRLALKTLDGEQEGVEHLSAGDSRFFAPAADGDTLDTLGERTTLSKTCNLGIFMSSLVENMTPEEIAAMPTSLKEEGAASGLVGVQFHILRKPAPKRGGIVRPRGGEEERERTVTVATKVVGLPWMEGASKGKKKGKAPAKAAPAKAKAKAPEVDEDEVAAEAITAIKEVLASANGDALPKMDVLRKVLVQVAASPHRQAIIQRAGDDGFLETHNAAHWLFVDGGLQGV